MNCFISNYFEVELKFVLLHICEDVRGVVGKISQSLYNSNGKSLSSLKCVNHLLIRTFVSCVTCFVTALLQQQI